MSVTRAVQGALSVRPQEGRLVLLLLVHSFFVGIPRVLTSTAAMALFLAHFDATELPYVYMAAAVAIPLSGFFRLNLANRLSLGRLLAVDLVFVFLALLAFRAALMSPWVVVVAMVLPVWAEVEWVVLVEVVGVAGGQVVHEGAPQGHQPVDQGALQTLLQQRARLGRAVGGLRRRPTWIGVGGTVPRNVYDRIDVLLAQRGRAEQLRGGFEVGQVDLRVAEAGTLRGQKPVEGARGRVVSERVNQGDGSVVKQPRESGPGYARPKLPG